MMLESIGCIFCKNKESDARVVIEENGFMGRKCPGCGLIYISPRPSLAEVNSLYDDDRANVSSSSLIANSFVSRLYAKQNLSILGHYKKRGVLLEIGAGAGYFLDEARKVGFDVFGIEMNSIQAQFINRQLNIQCEIVGLADAFGEDRFDVVYHSDVISHFFDPIQEFREMNGRLKQDGILIFETGNGGDIDEKYYSLIAKWQYPDHLFFFSESNLRSLLNITGFELITVRRFSILYQLEAIRFISNLRIMFMPKLRSAMSKPSNSSKYDRALSTGVSGSSKPPKTKDDWERFGQVMKTLLGFFFYLLRYKIGYLVPTKGKPQTLVVVARKKQGK